ncbi:hypothetical protein PVA17_07390 [Lysinibacillus sp. CNPSo 3705]|uniref:hypothetical protein n=1 Tax=Lysinibacillus sp. CNPSo 3705 TaxID=3028148 RepID=UPI002363550A|nr:hypothetical protein [Lysinibacillus sp. CNPSo 3705]MDD1502590.1 hypothetical protein [Lysinibacillus sp. CNPSo 3705]
MKRFWLRLPEKNDYLEITATNNKLSLFESSTEKAYTVDTGIYSLERLRDNLVSKGLDARIGEIKDSKNFKFIVLFLNNSFTYVNGSFITFIGGIESIDTGDRLEGNIIYI